MSTTDFLVTTGAVSVGALRLSLRSLLPVTPAFARKVSDDEAAAFLKLLAPTPEPASPALMPAGR